MRVLKDHDAYVVVRDVLVAMDNGDSRTFPVVREQLDHAEAIFGFKGGFDQVSLTFWPCAE